MSHAVLRSRLANYADELYVQNSGARDSNPQLPVFPKATVLPSLPRYATAPHLPAIVMCGYVGLHLDRSASLGMYMAQP